MSHAVAMKLKIKRAKKHVREFEKIIALFVKGNPYRVSEEIDSQTGDKVYRIRIDEKIPDDCPLIIGDALNNLRSALDYVAWQLVQTNGGIPDKRTQFPICDSLSKYEKTGNGAKIQGASPAAISILDAIKPYQGGNDGLWLLSQLNNIDKHRLLIGANFTLNDMRINSSGSRPFNTILGGVMFIEDGREVGRIHAPFDIADKVDLQITSVISFIEPEIVKGNAVIPLLHQLCGLIDGIVDLFKPVL